MIININLARIIYNQLKESLTKVVGIEFCGRQVIEMWYLYQSVINAVSVFECEGVLPSGVSPASI